MPTARTDARSDLAESVRWLRFWRSPADQPGWARPVLLLIAAGAALSYAWGITHQVPHLYYAAAARSMSMSVHNFVFGAFDPEARLGIDKLPGALWPQALSVWLFGPHTWAVVLPQVIEGVLTILVLYRMVRRVRGPVAGTVAALVAAVVPVTVALGRGNLPDALLVLLLVLLADRVLALIENGRRADAVYAGILAGAAFQVKMVQAWLPVALFAVVLVVTAPRDLLRQRIRATAIFGLVTLVVSLVWMSAVQLVPAAQRPYADGSHGNSLYEQVFLYNAADRADPAFDVGAGSFGNGKGQSYRAALVLGPDNRLDHLFTGGGGRDAGWLVPLAVFALIALAIMARRWGRTDLRTAAVGMWGGWLLIHSVVFLVVGTVNPYYLAVLTPAVAALLGLGFVEYLRALSRPAVLWATWCAVLVTLAYGCLLLAPAPPAVRWATSGVALALCAGAALLQASPTRFAESDATVAGSRRMVLPSALLLAAVLAAPAAASSALVADNYGSLDMPFESGATSAISQKAQGEAFREAPNLLSELRHTAPGARYPLIASTSMIAAPFIFTAGIEVPVIGGFTGTAPVISVEQLAAMVAHGDVGLALVTPSADPRVQWIGRHCRLLPGGDSVRAYACAPAPPKRG